MTRRGTFNPPRYSDYKKGLVSALLMVSGSFNPAGRFRLVVDAYRSTRRVVDVDNLAKSVMDALQEAGLVDNDSQIEDLRVRKHLDRENPRVIFSLEKIRE